MSIVHRVHTIVHIYRQTKKLAKLIHHLFAKGH